MEGSKKIFFIFGLVLFLSLTFASANIFDDLWGSFTGKVIQAPENSQQCIDCAAPPQGCSYSGASCSTCGTLVSDSGGECNGEVLVTEVVKDCGEFSDGSFECEEGQTVDGVVTVTHIEDADFVQLTSWGTLAKDESPELAVGSSWRVNFLDGTFNSYINVVGIEKDKYVNLTVSSSPEGVETCSKVSGSEYKCMEGQSVVGSIFVKNIEDADFVQLTSGNIFVKDESPELAVGSSWKIIRSKDGSVGYVNVLNIEKDKSVTLELGESPKGIETCSKVSDELVYKCKEGQAIAGSITVKNIEDADFVQLTSGNIFVKDESPELAVGSSWKIIRSKDGSVGYVNVLNIEKDKSVTLELGESPKGIENNSTKIFPLKIFPSVFGINSQKNLSVYTFFPKFIDCNQSIISPSGKVFSLGSGGCRTNGESSFGMSIQNYLIPQILGSDFGTWKIVVQGNNKSYNGGSYYSEEKFIYSKNPKIYSLKIIPSTFGKDFQGELEGYTYFPKFIDCNYFMISPSGDKAFPLGSGGCNANGKSSFGMSMQNYLIQILGSDFGTWKIVVQGENSDLGYFSEGNFGYLNSQQEEKSYCKQLGENNNSYFCKYYVNSPRVVNIRKGEVKLKIGDSQETPWLKELDKYNFKVDRQDWSVRVLKIFYSPNSSVDSYVEIKTFRLSISKEECNNGCFSNERCYPLGYRKGGDYCSEDNTFISQTSGDNNCSNNFECGSNLCVNSSCVSEGLLQKILSWFSRLFG